MVSITVAKRTTADVGSPLEDGKVWHGATVRTVGDQEFVVFNKGDPCFTQWLTQKKSHATRVSALVGLLTDIQAEASSDALGHDRSLEGIKTAYRIRMEKIALQALAESSTQTIVDVVLPSFDVDGERVAAVHTKMPMDPNPVDAMVALDPDVLAYVYKRFGTTVAPPPRRKAQYPPVELDDGSTAYYHKHKRTMVKRAKGPDGRYHFATLPRDSPVKTEASASAAGDSPAKTEADASAAGYGENEGEEGGSVSPSDSEQPAVSVD